MKKSNIWPLAIIVVAVVVALLMLVKCGGNDTASDYVKINGKSYRVVKTQIDTLPPPPPDTVFIETISPVIVQQVVVDTIIDTVEVIKDFYSISSYSQDFEGENYTANLTFDIYKCAVENMTFTHQLKNGGVKEKIYLERPGRFKLYVGVAASISTTPDVAPSVMMVPKNDIVMFGGGYGLIQKSAQFSVYYKISLRRKP